MPGDMVKIVQMCRICKTEIGTIEVKKENMMLGTKASIWCPTCQAETPEVRDVVGRLDSIEKEATTLPQDT